MGTYDAFWQRPPSFDFFTNFASAAFCVNTTYEPTGARLVVGWTNLCGAFAQIMGSNTSGLGDWSDLQFAANYLAVRSYQSWLWSPLGGWAPYFLAVSYANGPVPGGSWAGGAASQGGMGVQSCAAGDGGWSPPGGCAPGGTPPAGGYAPCWEPGAPTGCTGLAPGGGWGADGPPPGGGWTPPSGQNTQLYITRMSTFIADAFSQYQALSNTGPY